MADSQTPKAGEVQEGTPKTGSTSVEEVANFQRPERIDLSTDGAEEFQGAPGPTSAPGSTNALGDAGAATIRVLRVSSYSSAYFGDDPL